MFHARAAFTLLRPMCRAPASQLMLAEHGWINESTQREIPDSYPGVRGVEKYTEEEEAAVRTMQAAFRASD